MHTPIRLIYANTRPAQEAAVPIRLIYTKQKTSGRGGLIERLLRAATRRPAQQNQR